MEVITGSANDIYHLIKEARKKAAQTRNVNYQTESFRDVLAEMEIASKLNKNIYPALNFGTLTRGILYKANKYAITLNQGTKGLNFQAVILNSLSQYVYNKDFEEVYGRYQAPDKLQGQKIGEPIQSGVQETLNPANEYDFTPNTNPDEIQSVITEIADELAYNYFSNSFGNDTVREIANCRDIFKPEHQHKFEERWGRGDRIRNILVVGAGATFDAYTAIPKGEEFAESILSLFKDEPKLDKLLFHEMMAKITGTEKTGSLILENLFKVLSHFLSPAEIQEKIKNLVEFRYSVSLFNEIVAHMLKHAFLDVVVNFNFDETLDQAIREEIGVENYHQVINDGNCVMLDQILVDGRLQSPVYIKPHGTYSYKSSLRVPGHVQQQLPGDIKIMLEELVHGRCGDNDHFKRVNIIMVGFSCSSSEFSSILNEKLPDGSVIYHLDVKPFASAEAFFKEKPLEKFKELALPNRKIEEMYRPLSTAQFNTDNDPEKNNTLTPSLGELFSVLWRVQNDRFQAAYKPRSIARHELISYLFYRPELGAKTDLAAASVKGRKFLTEIENSSGFFVDRLMVEFFILLNRSNGMLDVVEVLKGRPGLYYNKYREIVERNSSGDKEPLVKTIYEFLLAFSKKDPKNPNNLLRQVREFNRGANIFTLVSEFEDIDLKEETFPGELANRMSQLKASLSAISNPVGTKLSKVHLDKLIDNFLADITDYIQLWYDTISYPEKPTNKNPQHELVKFGRAVTLLLRLLKSEFVSPYFKINLLYNYKRTVFNGKFIDSETKRPLVDGNVLFNELFRLLKKSWGHHYFVIDPKPVNTAHNLWESFTRKKVIHTNLARAAEFNNLLVQKDWDVFLSVTETGSFLNFLHHLKENLNGERADEEIAKIKRSHFVLICSYESIKQLYPGRYDNESKPDLIKEHGAGIRLSLPDGTELIEDLHFSLLILPFNQHNHHSYIFLKPGKNLVETVHNTILTNLNTQFQEEPRVGTFAYDAVGSIYFYRRGLSNSIDPVFIGRGAQDNSSLRNRHIFSDQLRLLDMFVKHLNRSFKFELVKRPKGTPCWPKAPWLKILQERWEKRIDQADAPFKDITTSEFLEALYTQFAGRF